MNELTAEIHGEIAAKLEDGLVGEAVMVMRSRLVPIISADLRRRFDHISKQDGNDIATEAVDIVQRRLVECVTSIPNPGAYAWKTAIRAGWRRNRHNQQFHHLELDAAELYFGNYSPRDEQLLAPHPHFSGSDRAKFIYEGLIENDNISAEGANKAIRACMSELDQRSRGILELLLRHGPKISAETAAAMLDITPVGFRVGKHRLYKELLKLLPKTAEELGVAVYRHPLTEEGSIADALFLDDGTVGSEADDVESTL
jgi:hypothetical protein